MFVSYFGKASLSLGFLSSYFFAYVKTNLVSGTMGIEDTYRTLTAIPFQVVVNNFLKIFVVTGI